MTAAVDRDLARIQEELVEAVAAHVLMQRDVLGVPAVVVGREECRQAETMRWLIDNVASPKPHLASVSGTALAAGLGETREALETAEGPETPAASAVPLSAAAIGGDTPSSRLRIAPSEILVSVVMPVWNRASVMATAIESVFAQTHTNWELLIVDDGSTDHSIEVASRFLNDPRVHLLAGSHAGVSAARNRALREARGEVVAYLDSDNAWFPNFLSAIAAPFERDPEIESVYTAQVVENAEQGESFVRAVPFDRTKYLTDGGIDLNVFAHRRRLFEELGGFEERMTRLVDWELISRYTARSAPVLLPTIGGRYFENRSDSISSRESLPINRALLRQLQQRVTRSVTRPLRVLWAVWNYPQLTETYIRCELAAMRRWGVEVEVLSEITDTKSPYASDVPVHHGSLAETIANVRPDVVHVHWLNKGKDYREVIARAGLPMTVRGHSYEFATKSVKKLLRDPTVRSVYLFPHFANQFGAQQIGSNPKIHPMTSAFNEDWFYPPEKKDRCLVLRTGAGKPTKGLEAFLEIASRCPEHRFVLVLGLLPNLDDYVERLLAENRRLGSPVEIRQNLSNEESAALMREAGIYLHTYGDDEPFGMPVSIAESLATGAFTLARDLPGAAEYLGTAGTLYRTNDEAVLAIQSTLTWSDDEWQSQQSRAIAAAQQRFASERVLRPLLEDWRSLADATGLFQNPLARAA